MNRLSQSAVTLMKAPYEHRNAMARSVKISQGIKDFKVQRYLPLCNSTMLILTLKEIKYAFYRPT